MTDFSIGFEPGKVSRVRDGEKKTIGGRSYSGPTRVVTSAKVREGSAVAIGADEDAKALPMPALRAYTQPEQLLEESEMTILRDICLANGMPADHEDFEQWAKENLEKRQAEPPKKEEPKPEPETDSGTCEDERVRAAKITDFCASRGLSMNQAASYIASSMTSGEVAEDILKRESRQKISNEPVGKGPEIVPLESEADKFVDGARGALIQRCLMGVNVDRAEKHAKGEYSHRGQEHQTHFKDHSALEQVEEVRQLIESPVARDFRNIGLYDMARMFVEYSGVRTWGLSRDQVVREAFRLDTRSPAYHTTGSFTNVMLDAAKKTLLMAFEEASVTYPMWVRQAPSTSDFKTINRIRLGELPSPDIVAENGKYGEAAVSDSKESYEVAKHGHIFSISLEAVVNDDLNAISRIPAQQGMAMRRKINAECLAVLTGNAALSDGIALFHSTSHGANLDSNALSVSALNTGWTVMATQTGLNSSVVLNVTPRYLIVPAALAYTALQIAGSIADPSNTAGSTEDATRPNYNSGTLNVYGPQGSRPLTPIVDATLDGSSATAWYLAAEPTQIDTVELTFLQGEETPYLERENTFDVDSVRYKIRQTFAAKAIDYRGLYQGNS
jgi:hypothetical protein